MEWIYQLLDHYSFFQERKGYKVQEIQNYGRQSKFLVQYQEEYYTVFVSEKRIQKYLSRLKFLSDDYYKMIQFKYLSDDHRVLVLGYYGNIDGKNLSLLSHVSELSDEIVASQILELMKKLHYHKASYIDFDSKGSTWYEYIQSMLRESLNKSYSLGAISDVERNKVLEIIQLNQKYFESVDCCYIHGDLTIVNVCYSKSLESVYFIDYDDFMIGDPFYDYSRLMNFASDSSILSVFKEKYCSDIDDNIIHTIYTLRVTLNWFNYIKEHDLDYELPVKEIKCLLEKIFNYTK